MTRGVGASTTGRSTVEARRAQIRLLLVEDFEEARETILDLLQLLGYEVTPAGDIDEALRLKGVPDVLVSDVGLPDGTGCELLTQLRQRAGWENVPAIAISAHDSEEDLYQAECAGFVRYLVKPLSLHELDQAILQVATR